MSKFIFPYSFELLENRKIFAYPTVNITLKKLTSKNEFSFLILVDSGAELSLFPKSDSELLGLKLEQGQKINIGSASGDKFLAFLHPVMMKIGNKRIKIEAAFSSKDNTPRVLGRNPLFSHFFIAFDHKKQNTIFIPRSDKQFEKSIYS
ncbi:hypothetical protein FJ208_01935 [Candidatus Gribaldobacteria bacterium]|nr:hypothetical protein [Candidatus Gribaldobacteria bacterium]